MLIGYARVSTKDQNLDLQIDALQKAGCEKIFTDKISGLAATRPEFLAMATQLRAGDTVVVYSLSRLGRGLKHLIHQVEEFKNQGVNFKSITENLDTSTKEGKFIFHIFCSIAEFERDLIAERTQAGVDAARARGRVGGRKPELTPRQVEELKRCYNERKLSISDLCIKFKISKTTLYKYLAK